MGDISELKKVREDKEAKLKEYGVNTRPDSFKYTHTLKEDEINTVFNNIIQAIEKECKAVLRS